MARKTRTTIRDVKNDFFDIKNTEPDKLFEHLSADGVSVPDWSKYCLLVCRKLKKTYDVGFFEDEQEFYVRYSKVLLMTRSDAVQFLTFSKTKNWGTFFPPTLIGIELKTKLRNA